MPVNTTKSADLLRFDVQPLQCLQAHSLGTIKCDKMDWRKYFETLIDWKKLPAYRAEPRIDSLLGFYLNEILSDFKKIKIDGIIPELPLRLGTIHPEHNEKNFADRSYKVDFFAIGNNGVNYLIEFKTDPSSRRDSQDIYLIKSTELGTKKLLDGILTIAKVSSYKNKYRHLLDKLIEYGLFSVDLNYTGKNPICETIYIIPSNTNKANNVIDFQRIVNWFEKSEKLDDFEKSFKDTLQLWFTQYSDESKNNGA